MSKTIHYYFSPISPFAYLAGDQLENEAPGELVYHPFELPVLFAETGAVPLPKRSPQRKAYRYTELERIAKRRNLPINLNPKHFPTNTVPACCLILAARNQGIDVGPLLKSLLKAVWVEERDIADLTVLKEILSAHQIDTGLVDQIDDYESGLANETQEAIDAGVFGSPFYIVDGEPFWGQDKLDEALAAARA